MDQDLQVVSLPAIVASHVDAAFESFRTAIDPEGALGSNGQLRIYPRWHGADVWLVTQQDDTSQHGIPATRQLTVTAYSDEPDRLYFLPDIVSYGVYGRSRLASTTRAELQRSVSVSVVYSRLISNRNSADIERTIVSDGTVVSILHDYMLRTWNSVSYFQVSEAQLELIP